MHTLTGELGDSSCPGQSEGLSFCSLIKTALLYALEGEWDKLEALADVEFVLELHPVQAEGVQEGRKALHDEEDADGEHGEGPKDERQGEESPAAPGRQAQAHHHGPQHFRQLCMGQAEGPQAQVGGCVGDAAQAVLYGVDGLVHRYVAKVKRLLL